MNFAMFECSTVCSYVAYLTISMVEAYKGFEVALSGALLSPPIFQYDWVHVLNQFTECFTENFKNIFKHAQTMCTRPILLHIGPGDEANQDNVS